MAWTCSGSTNDELIDNLISAKLIQTPHIVGQALRRVDRGFYVPADEDSQTNVRQVGQVKAYMDCPQLIGFGATISAPHMHVAALESLVEPLTPPRADSKETEAVIGVHSNMSRKGGGERRRRAVLDVGCGSGYLTAAFYHMLDLTSRPPHHPSTSSFSSSSSPPSPAILNSQSPNYQDIVVGIDHLPELTNLTMRNLKRDGLSPRWGIDSARREDDESDGGIDGVDEDEGGIIIVTGDGRLGYPHHAPYDAIHVGAAAPELPQALVDQLASPGRMFIPIGTTTQDIWRIDKDERGVVTKKKLFGVRYVPLTDSRAQWAG